jgi:hypothetical protein
MRNSMTFEHILLEPEQEQLLVTVVEASRNVSRDQRQKFFVFEGIRDNSISHPGLPGGEIPAYSGDVEILGSKGLVNLSYGTQGSPLFDVTPEGFAYYEYFKRKSGEPVQQIAAEVRSYLDSQSFGLSHPNSFQKWLEAEQLLWGSDSQRQLTTIGHLCREAAQEFATELVDSWTPSDVDSDVKHVVARVRAVLDQHREKLTTTEKPFLDALIAYWGALSDLIQRQEHGAQKEGDVLVWEDARRIVFQTAVAMFEIDRSLAAKS